MSNVQSGTENKQITSGKSQKQSVEMMFTLKQCSMDPVTGQTFLTEYVSVYQNRMCRWDSPEGNISLISRMKE